MFFLSSDEHDENELEDLEADANLTVEELRAKYGYKEGNEEDEEGSEEAEQDEEAEEEEEAEGTRTAFGNMTVFFNISIWILFGSENPHNF